MLYMDNRNEYFLSILNNYLKKSRDLFPSEKKEPELPVIFVIGAPMTGSTLISQVLLHSKLFAGISNFVARFWEAPYVGALIEQIFNWENESNNLEFQSVHGQTKGLRGSHEFGNFWNRWFDLGADTHKLTEAELVKVDQTSLKQDLANLENIYQKPLLFKNNTWCSFQAEWLSKVFPSSIFVVCERPILYSAQWLLLTRRKIYNDDNKWWSVKPSNYPLIKKKGKWEQVLLQAFHCQKETNEAVFKIPVGRVVRVEYKNVCEKPMDILSRVVDLCNMQGAKIVTGEMPDYPNFTHTDAQHLNDEDWRELVQTHATMKW